MRRSLFEAAAHTIVTAGFGLTLAHHLSLFAANIDLWGSQDGSNGSGQRAAEGRAEEEDFREAVSNGAHCNGVVGWVEENVLLGRRVLRRLVAAARLLRTRLEDATFLEGLQKFGTFTRRELHVGDWRSS